MIVDCTVERVRRRRGRAGWTKLRVKAAAKSHRGHFPISSNEGWALAADVHVGDRLRSDTGAEIVVKKVRNWSGHHEMHDITVNHTHTFYVQAGGESILVHNCGGAYGDDGTALGKWLRR